MLKITDVEKRILRACVTLRAVPDPDKKYQQFRSLWPETVNSTEEAYGYTLTNIPRFRPSPRDISDYLTALTWAKGMEWRDFRLVWWRSYGTGFKHIAAKLHKSDDTARRWYRDCIVRLWHKANNL